MGERFLMYYFRQPDRHEMGYRVLDDSDDVAGDTALTEAFTTFIEGVAVPETLPLLDDDAKKAIVDLAEMATRARSGVERNEQSRKQEMKFAHDAEMPARFIKQLRSLAFGLIAINGDGKLTDGDKQMLYNIALDSIPKQRRTAMVELTKNAWMDQGAIAQAVKLPEEEVRRWLEELRALGVIESHRDVNKKLLWGLKEEYRRVMSRFESITMTDNTVENDGSDEDEEETVQWGVRI
jgi:carboxypeptidase C (cathepsin A)